MLKKSAPIRFFSNSVGLVFQILTIFFTTKYLGIYQFALWGVANSLIYIFSSLNQFGYVQNIEKFFPNYDDNLKIHYFSKFFKTLILMLPIWLFILYILNTANFFEKYNAENIYIFIFLLLFTIICESLISIYNPFFITLNKSEYFDLSNLLISKIVKFFVFLYLLLNSFSVYYLLLFNLVLRSLFLMVLVIKTNNLFKSFYKTIFSVKLFSNKTENFKYNVFAYIDKTLYVSFINFLFLICTVFAENEAISHFSLVILIVNNLRPVFDSLPSLLTKRVSELTFKNFKSKNFRKNNLFTVSITFSFLIIATYLLISNSSILEFFLGDFESGIFKLIFLSVFVSAIHSFYYPIYLEVLYKNNEVKLVRFNLLNYFFCTILYFFLSNNYTLNFLYIFLIYEVFNIIYIFFKFRNIANYKINLKSEINYISLSIFPVMIIIFNLIMNIEINQILIFISISCLIVDVIRFLKLNKLFFHKNR